MIDVFVIRKDINYNICHSNIREVSHPYSIFKNVPMENCAIHTYEAIIDWCQERNWA